MMMRFHIKQLRRTAIFLGISNLFLIIVGVVLIDAAMHGCVFVDILPFLVILIVSCLRMATMMPVALAQRATAMMIINNPTETPAVGTLVRRHRRIRYKKWLWWTRFALLITVLQFAGATYLLFSVSQHIFEDRTENACILDLGSTTKKWEHTVLVIFVVMACFVALLQCFSGSDVLRWRSFYTNENKAWKRHYREVFDHGIREALCCLGRFKYLTVMEEDEVFSVAQLLGDLVSYRASGTGHLEFLAGLALLQKESLSPNLQEETMEAPVELLHGAAEFHPFAEAAYTGLLLDVGRNPVLFLCAWFYRQGILTPWSWKRLPVLKGDNWWRGHARAFLKYVNLPAEVLRQGRVSQARCEAAYFVVVLHHIKTVVIAVRGTETPEDLITDGLCRECVLSREDLDGLICGNLIPPGSAYYGHSGIVEAARDLYLQIEGNPGNEGGFLSSLLGAGCECDGYNLRIVGHSLGGAIAAMLGFRLYGQYPKLHVYCYGPLPCVDSATADACSNFVTSIVYHNEFSSRLSIASIMRLQAAAVMALSTNSAADLAIVHRLARRFVSVSTYLWCKPEEKPIASGLTSTSITCENKHFNERIQEQEEHFSLWQDMDKEDSSDDDSVGDENDSSQSFSNPFCVSSSGVNLRENLVTEFIEALPAPKDESSGNFREMFLPGNIVHIVPKKKSFDIPLYKRWSNQDLECHYEAYLAKREAFKDMIVSPSMFIDHLPWRCSYALKKVLQKRNLEALPKKSQLV